MKVWSYSRWRSPILRLLVELGVVIGRGGANIKAEHVAGHIAGYVLALDLTARDLQVSHPLLKE